MPKANQPRGRWCIPSHLWEVCHYCVSDGVPRRSFAVALIVGTILNLINQGDELLDGGHINLLKLLLTFAVPYCLATYGAVSLRMTTMKAGTLPRTGGDAPPPIDLGDL